MADKCKVNFDPENLFSIVVELQETFLKGLAKMEEAASKRGEKGQERIVELIKKSKSVSSLEANKGINVDKGGIFWMVESGSEEEVLSSMAELSTSMYKVIKPGETLKASFSPDNEGVYEAKIDDEHTIKFVPLSQYKEYLDLAPLWIKQKLDNGGEKYAFVLFKKDEYGGEVPIMSLGVASPDNFIKEEGQGGIVYFKTTKSLYAGTNSRYYINEAGGSRISLPFNKWVKGLKSGDDSIEVSRPFIFYGDKVWRGKSIINVLYPFIKPGTPFVFVVKGDNKDHAGNILSQLYTLFQKPTWGGRDIDEFDAISDRITIRLLTTEINLYDLPEFVAKNISGKELSLKAEKGERLYNIFLYNRVFNADKVENTVVYKIFHLVLKSMNNNKIIKALKEAGVDTELYSEEAAKYLQGVNQKLTMSEMLGRGRIAFDTAPLMYMFKTIYDTVSQDEKALAEWNKLREAEGLEETVRLNVSPDPFTDDKKRRASNAIAAPALSFLSDVAVLRESSLGVPAISLEFESEGAAAVDRGGISSEDVAPAVSEEANNQDAEQNRSVEGAGWGARKRRKRKKTREVSSGAVEFKDSVAKIRYLINKAFGGNVEVAFEGDLIEVDVEGELKLAYGVATPLMIRLAKQGGQASTKVAVHEMVHQLKYFLPREEYESFIQKARMELIKSGRVDNTLPEEEVEEQLALWVEQYVDRFENDILFGRYYDIRDRLPSILRPVFDVLVAAYYRFLRLFRMIDRNVAVDTVYRLYTGEFSNLDPSSDEFVSVPEENTRLADKAVYSKLTALHNVIISLARGVDISTFGDKVASIIDIDEWRDLTNDVLLKYSPDSKVISSSYLISKQPGYKGDKQLDRAWETLLSAVLEVEGAKISKNRYAELMKEALDAVYEKVKSGAPTYLPKMIYLSSFEGDSIYKAYNVPDGDDSMLLNILDEEGAYFTYVVHLLSKAILGNDAYYYDANTGLSYNVFATGMFLNALAINNEEYFRDMLKMPGMAQVYKVFLQKASTLLPKDENELYEKIETVDEKGNKVTKLVLKSNESISFSNDEVSEVFDSIETLLDELEDEEATSWRDIDEKKTFSLSEALRMAIEGLVKPDLKPGELDDFFAPLKAYKPEELSSRRRDRASYENKFVRGEDLVKEIRYMIEEGADLSDVLARVDGILAKAKNRVNYLNVAPTDSSMPDEILTLSHVKNPYVDFLQKGASFVEDTMKVSSLAIHYAGSNIDFYARALQDVINYAHDYIEMNRMAGRKITPELFDKAFQYGALIVGSTRPDIYALVFAFYNQYVAPAYKETPFFAAFDKDPSEAVLQIFADKMEKVAAANGGGEFKESVSRFKNALSEYRDKNAKEFNRRVFVLQKIMTTLFNYVKYDSVSVSLSNEPQRSGTDIDKLGKETDTIVNVSTSFTESVLETIFNTFFIKKGEFHGYLSNLEKVKDVKPFFSPNIGAVYSMFDGAEDFYILGLRRSGTILIVDAGEEDTSPFIEDILKVTNLSIEVSNKNKKSDVHDIIKNSPEVKAINKKYHFVTDVNVDDTSFIDYVFESHVFHASPTAYNEDTESFRDGVIGTFFSMYGHIFSVIKVGDEFFFVEVKPSEYGSDVVSDDTLAVLSKYAKEHNIEWLQKNVKASLKEEIKLEYNNAISDIYNKTASYLALTGDVERDALITIKSALTVLANSASPQNTFFDIRNASVNGLREYIVDTVGLNEFSLRSRNMLLSNSIQKINERGAGIKRKALYSQHSIAHNISRMYAYGIGPRLFKYVPELKGITRRQSSSRPHPILDSNRFRGDAAVITKVKSMVDGKEHDVTDLYPADYAMLSYMGVMTFPAVGRNTYLYLNATTGYDAPQNYRLRRDYFKALVHEIFSMLRDSDLNGQMKKIAGTSFNIDKLASTAFDSDVQAKIEVIQRLFDSLEGEEGVVALRKAGLVEKLAYEVKGDKIQLPKQLVTEATKTETEVTLSLLRSAIKDLDMYRTMMRSEPPEGTGVVSDIYARKGYKMAGKGYYEMMTIEADVYAAMVDYIEKGDMSRLIGYFPMVEKAEASTADERAAVVRRLAGITREERKDLELKEGELPKMNTPSLPARDLRSDKWERLGSAIYTNNLPRHIGELIEELTGVDFVRFINDYIRNEGDNRVSQENLRDLKRFGVVIATIEGVLSLAGIDTKPFLEILKEKVEGVAKIEEGADLLFSVIGFFSHPGELSKLLKKAYPGISDLNYPESLATLSQRVRFANEIIEAFSQLMDEEVAKDLKKLINKPFGKKDVSDVDFDIYNVRDRKYSKNLDMVFNMAGTFSEEIRKYVVTKRSDLLGIERLTSDGIGGFMPRGELIEEIRAAQKERQERRKVPFSKELNEIVFRLIPSEKGVERIAKAISEGKMDEDGLWKLYTEDTGISIRQDMRKDIIRAYPISKLVDQYGNINIDMLGRLYRLLLVTAGDYKINPFRFTPEFYRKFPDLKTRFFVSFILNNKAKESKVKVKGAPYSIIGEEERMLAYKHELTPFKSGYADTLDLGNLQALHNELNFFHTAVAFMGNPLAYKNVETMVKRYVAVQTGRTLPVMNKYYQPPSKWRFIITKDKTIKDFFKGKESLAEGNDYMSSLANGYNQLLHLSELGVVGDPETPVDDGGGFMLPYVASPILGYDRYEPGPYKDAFSKTDAGLGGKTVFLKHAHFPLPPGFAYNGSERLFAIFDRLFETQDGALKKEVSDLMKSLYDEGMERHSKADLATAYMLDRMRDKDIQEELAEMVRRHMPKLKYLGIMPESASKNSKDYVAVDVDKLAEEKDLEAKGVPADVTGYGMVTYLFQKLGNIRIKSPSQHRNVFQGSGVNAKLFDRISEVFSFIIENNLSAISDVLSLQINRELQFIKEGSDVTLVAELKDIIESLKNADETNRSDVVLEALNKLYMIMSLAEDDVVTLTNGVTIPLRRFIQNIITNTIRYSVSGLDGSAALLDILKKPDNIAFPSLIETVHEGLSRMFASKSRSVRGNRLIIQGASHIAEVVEVEIEHKQGDQVRYEYRLMSKQEAVKQGFLSAKTTFGDGLPKVTYKPKQKDGVRVVIRPIRAHMFVKEDPVTGKRSFLSDEEINKINELYIAHYKRGEYSTYSRHLNELNEFFEKNNIKVLHGEVVVGNVFMDNFALRPGMAISDYGSDYARAVHVLEEAGVLSQYKLMKDMSLEEFINLPEVRSAVLKNIVREGNEEPVRVEDLFVKGDDGRLLPKVADLSSMNLMVVLKREEAVGEGEEMVIETRETAASQKVASARFLLKTDGKGMSEEQMLAHAEANDKKVLSEEDRARLIDMPLAMPVADYFALVSAATRRSFDKAMNTLVATRIPVSNINAIRGLRIVAFEDIGNVAFVPSEYLFIAGEDSDGDAYTTEMLETKRLIVEPSMQNKKVTDMVDMLYSPLNLISTYRELSIDGTISRFSLVYDKVYGEEEAESDISDRVSLAGMTSRAVTASISQKLIGLTVKGNEGVNLLKASLLNLKKRYDIDDKTFDKLVRRLTGLSDRYKGKFKSGFGFVHYAKDEAGNLVEEDTFVRAFNPDDIHLYKESAAYRVYTKGKSFVEGGSTINEAIEVFLNIALDANKYDLSKLNLSAYTGQYINTLLMMGVDVEDIIRFNLHPMMMVIRQVLESSESRNVESELLAELGEDDGIVNQTYEDIKRAAVSMMVSSNHPLMKEIRKKVAAMDKGEVAALPVATPGQETTASQLSDKSIAELLADYILDFYANMGDLSYGDKKEKDGNEYYVYDRSVPSRDKLVKTISRGLGRHGNKLSLADIERELAFQLNDNFKKVFDFWGLVVDMKQKVSGVMAVLEIFKEKSPNYHKFIMQMTKVLNNIFRTDEERRFMQLNLLRLLSEEDVVGALERIDDKDMAKVMVLGNPQMRSELRAMLMEHYVTAMLSPAMNSELHHMLMRLFSIYGVKNMIKTKRLSSAINNLLKYEYTLKVYGSQHYRSLIIDYVKSEAEKAVNAEDKVSLNNLYIALKALDKEISNEYKKGRKDDYVPEEKILAFAFTLGREFTHMMARIAGPRLDGWGLYVDNAGEMPVLRTSKSDSQMDSSAIMARNQAIARMVISNPLLHLAAHAHATVLDDHLSSRSIISFMPKVLSVMPPGLESLSFSRMVTRLDVYKHLQEISLLPPDLQRFTTKDGSVKYYNKLHSGHDILNVLNMLAMDIVKGADERYSVEGIVPGAVIRPYLSGNTIRLGYESSLNTDMFSSNQMVSKTILVEGKTHFIQDFARPGYHSKTFVIASQLGIPAFERKGGGWNTRIGEAGPVFRRNGATSLLVMERKAASVINPAFSLTVEGPYIELTERQKSNWRQGIEIAVADMRKDILSYLQSLRTSTHEDPVESYRLFLRDKAKELLGGTDIYGDTIRLVKEIHDKLNQYIRTVKSLIKDEHAKNTLDKLIMKRSDFIDKIAKGKAAVEKDLKLVTALAGHAGLPIEELKVISTNLEEALGAFDEQRAAILKEMISEAEEDRDNDYDYEDGYEDIESFSDVLDEVEDAKNKRQSLIDIIKDRPRVSLYSSLKQVEIKGGDENLTPNIQLYIARRNTEGKLLYPNRDMPVAMLAAIGGAFNYHPEDSGYVSFAHPYVKSVIYDAVKLSNQVIDKSNKPLLKKVDEEVLAAADVDNKLIGKVIEFITKKLGIQVEILNDPNESFIGMVGERGVIKLNMAHMTSDTPLHEVAHLFYAVMKKERPEHLAKISEAIKAGAIPDEVYNFMGYKSKEDMERSLRNAGYLEEQMEEEIVVSVLGAMATMQFSRHTSIIGSLRRLVDQAIAFFYEILERLGVGLNAKQLTLIAVNQMLYETDYRELEVVIGFKYKKVGSVKPDASLAEVLRNIRGLQGREEKTGITLEEKIHQAVMNEGQAHIPFGGRSIAVIGKNEAVTIQTYKEQINKLVSAFPRGAAEVATVLGLNKINSKSVSDEFATILSNASGDGTFVRELTASTLVSVFGLDQELAEEIMAMYDRNRLLLIARPDGDRLVYTLLEIVEGEESNTSAHVLNALFGSDAYAASVGSASGVHLTASERDLSMLRNVTLLKAIHGRQAEINGRVYTETYPSDVRRYNPLTNTIERVHPTIYYRSLVRMTKIKAFSALLPQKLLDFISSWRESDVSAFERNIIEEVKMAIDVVMAPFFGKKNKKEHPRYMKKARELYMAFSEYLDMPDNDDFPELIEKVREVIKGMMREYEERYSSDGRMTGLAMERLSRSTGYALLAEALQAIDMGNKINYYNVEKDISSFDREISPMLQSHSGVLAWFNKVHGKVMDQRIKYFTNFLSRINGFISSFKETARARLASLGANSEELYSHLFYIDEERGINTFRLLREGDKGWDSLSKEDKAFIRKVNETIKELLYDALFERALTRGMSVKEAQEEASSMLDDIYVEGMLPVFPPELMTKMMNALSYDSSRMAEIMKDFTHNQVERAKGTSNMLKNLLLVQFDGTELGTSYRQRVLGIYGKDVDIEQNKKLTRDIGKILTMSAFLNSKYVRYMELQTVYRAARSMLMFAQRRGGAAMDNLIAQLDKVAEAVIYGNRLSTGGTSFERAIGKFIHALNQTITVGVLGLSIKTATSNFLSNVMAIFRDALVKGSRSKDRFSLQDVSFAANELMNNTKKVMAVLKASRVFQSDEIDILTKRFWGNKPKLTDPSNMFIFDELGDKMARAITLIAQMKKDGTYDALDYDAETESLIVRENKLFMNKDENERDLLVRYVKNKAAIDGLVDEKGNITSLFYSDYIVRLQAIVNETLGSFSDLDKSAISTSAVMGAVTKFRSYMTALYTRAFGEERYNPNIRHLRVVDGKVEEITEFEVGIIRSIAKTATYLFHKRHFTESPLTEADKENLIMAMYIISVTSLMIFAGTQLLDDDDDDPRTKSFLQRIYRSAVDDMFAIMMFGNISSVLSNPFTTYSIVNRFAKGFEGLVTLDWERAGNYGLKTLGVFNTLDIIGGDYFDPSKELGKVSDALRKTLGMKTIEEERKEKQRMQGRKGALRRKYNEMIEAGVDPEVAFDIVAKEAETKGVDFRVPFYTH